jgi:hypothetical protein
VASVALAISTFRNDDSVLRTLEAVFAPDAPRFAAVIVVDSMGTGAIPAEIARRGWQVEYVNSDRNLGSAGNLALRLSTAEKLGMDWCYTVNHDSDADAETALRLLACAASHERVAACYPTRSYSRADGRIEPPRRTFTLFSPRGREEPIGDCGVAWGSSNFALYSLAPLRGGIHVWSDLWMCWEDLGYGWALSNGGWRQIQCAEVRLTEDFEYKRVRVLGKTLHLTDKPAWYMYYELRNLWTIGHRSGWRAVSIGDLIKKTAVDLALIVFVKRGRTERIRLLFSGLIAGMRGRLGKGSVPS